MKNLLLFGICLMAMYSCQKEKDYTCQCKYTYTKDTTIENITHETFEMKSKSEEQAVKDCKAHNARYESLDTKGECQLIPY